MASPGRPMPHLYNHGAHSYRPAWPVPPYQPMPPQYNQFPQFPPAMQQPPMQQPPAPPPPPPPGTTPAHIQAPSPMPPRAPLPAQGILRKQVEQQQQQQQQQHGGASKHPSEQAHRHADSHCRAAPSAVASSSSASQHHAHQRNNATDKDRSAVARTEESDGESKEAKQFHEAEYSRASNRPHVSTFVCVAKLNHKVSDEEVQQLVEACGEIKSVKRVHDPLTDQPRRFAFVEFNDPEGVMRSLRLLPKLELHGERITLSVNSSTKHFVDYYKENERSDSEGTDADYQGDARAEDAIAKVLEQYESKDFKAERQADDFLAEMAEEEAFAVLNEDNHTTHENPERHSEGQTAERADEGAGSDSEMESERRLKRKERERAQHEEELLRKWRQEEKREEEARAARQQALEQDLSEEMQQGRTQAQREERKRFRERERKEDSNVSASSEIWGDKNQSQQNPKVAASSSNLKIGLGGSKKRKAHRATGVLNSEEDEEEERKQKQRVGLVPLSSSKSDLESLRYANPQTDKAEDEDVPNDAMGADGQIKAPSEANTAEQAEQALDDVSILQSLPSTRDELYRCAIDWEAYERSDGSERVREWLEKKVSELLGEADEEMVSFVKEMVDKRSSALDLDKEMRPILEEDTDDFVMQLYRIILLETIRQLRREDSAP